MTNEQTLETTRDVLLKLLEIVDRNNENLTATAKRIFAKKERSREICVFLDDRDVPMYVAEEPFDVPFGRGGRWATFTEVGN